MADGLYERYMTAAAEHRQHASTCKSCSPTKRCADGRRLYEAFAKHQDDYNKHLAAKRR
ncbi:hypothetical protein GCM10010371_57110 [Streptomyces subrutilus]|uniref:Uncharacterized protein n=1 Tax=Streptomyces subrutilus TaxID=36818 RepID=A0A918R8Q4_9ACTN|nr:hypothetical protein [Streptomyces subrutilus]GGZ89807.1 hypothetical protein GCM10010371_57110 [Streptomyces subrutilus]